MKIISKILIGISLMFVTLCNAQHVIDDPTDPKQKTYMGSYNVKYLRTGIRESADSVHISASQITAGDSVLLLTGDKKAVITEVGVDYYCNTPYTTTGSTDTTTIYSLNDGSSEAVVYILDELYQNTSFVTYNTGGVYKSDSDSSYYYLKIPSSKFSVGDGYYILYYKYIILE